MESDSESPKPDFGNHPSSSRGVKKGTKRSCAISSSGSAGKDKRRKNSTRRQGISCPDNSDDDSGEPLSRNDISAIVSAVLSSLQSEDTLQSRLSELDDLPL